MNKGMIIFDKPNKCTECPCCYISPITPGCMMCQMTDDYVRPNQTAPDNCPVIPLDQEQMDNILAALQKRTKG